MSLRNINIAPRAFLGFALIGLLVVLLGVVALSRMSVIQDSTRSLGRDSLPSVAAMGDIVEDVLRLRSTSFRMMINRNPEQLVEAHGRFGPLIDKIKESQRKYEPLIDNETERANYQRFTVAFDDFVSLVPSMLEMSQQNKMEPLLRLINGRMKEDGDLMAEILKKNLRCQ